MAFDYNSNGCAITEIERLANKSLHDGGTITNRRALALAAFDLAIETLETDQDYLIDWHDVALALAAVMPKTKAAKSDVAADRGEWNCYTEAQSRGTHRAFRSGRQADFRFADGTIIRVQLRHRNNQDMPDWARAARCAVAFYKAKRARGFLVLTGMTASSYRFKASNGLLYGNLSDNAAEAYAKSCAVPAIVEAVDLSRDAKVDVAKANAETQEVREGPRYLAELEPFACDLGGDWAAAWRAVICQRHAETTLSMAA